ncbi:MAG: TonB family protein [Bacteroidales bacterium]
MEVLSLYLLKSGIAMILFYGFYRLMIFQNTYFRIRRFTLLGILFFSALYPFVNISDWLSRKEPVHEVLVPYIAELPEVAVTETITPAFSPGKILFVFYLCVSAFFAFRMLIQLAAVMRMRFKARPIQFQGHTVYRLDGSPAPFSFFHWIFMDPSQTTEQESHQILIHELTHVRQYHSIDMIIGELATVFFWFNPFAWLLKQEIRVNLEHLADHKVLESGTEATIYQYSLLRLCHPSKTNKLVNNFNIPQFKRRIIMMNKIKSSRNSLMRYAFLIPLAGILVVSGNVQAVVNKVKNEMVVLDAVSQNDAIKVSGQVVTPDGKSVQGANIIVQGTHNGTVSDHNGNFTLLMQKDQQLNISFVGLQRETVKPGFDGKPLKVVLSDSPVYQEDLIVVGYAASDTKKQEKKNPDKAAVKPGTTQNENPIFTVVEDMPTFPGGEQALWQYLGRSIKYPVSAQQNGIQGRVIVSYIISPEGKITSPQIVRGVDPALDQEALRVINAMPDWNPGKQRGKPVAVKYIFPVTFRLDKGKEADKSQQ